MSATEERVAHLAHAVDLRVDLKQTVSVVDVRVGLGVADRQPEARRVSRRLDRS